MIYWLIQIDNEFDFLVARKLFAILGICIFFEISPIRINIEQEASNQYQNKLYKVQLLDTIITIKLPTQAINKIYPTNTTEHLNY